MKKLLIIIGVTVGLNTSIVAGPIHEAARAGDIEEIKSLIDIGVSVEHKDAHGATALHASVYNSNFEVADFLISVGANVNAEDDFGLTPIFHSLYSNRINLFNLLINNGANVNHQDKAGRTPLMIPRESQFVSVLIENGAEIDAKDFSGRTALHHALREFLDEVILILLANKADVNAKDTLGKTPLDYGDPGHPGFNASTFELLQQAGAKSGLVLLEQKVDQLTTATTNPTDEWPRKMWEIDLGFDFGPSDGPSETDIVYLRQAKDGAVLFVVKIDVNDPRCYWVSNTGEPKSISDDAFEEGAPNRWKTIIYFDSQHFIYMDDNSDDPERELSTITKLTRHQNGINKSVFSADKFGYRYSTMDAIFDDDDGGVSKFQTVQLTTEGTKITAWDFTPPSSTAPKPDDGNGGGNGGGNETVNSRLIIKTSGPDIALATDGELGGAAELQKSNDLRSWRKLVDLPEEASEVLVTPRETGNEFFRLKKKE